MILLDKINTSILKQNDTIITKDLLCGNISLDNISNTPYLNATIDCLFCTERFDVSIFAQ